MAEVKMGTLYAKSSLMGKAQRSYYGAVNKVFGKSGTMSKAFKMSFTPLGMGFMGYSALSGYEEGGITGAVGGFAEAYAQDVAFNRLLLSGGTLARAGAVGLAAAAIGGGAYLALSAGNEYRRTRGKLEMGGGNIDPFGTAATMRQRSLMAMQRSHLNMRSALGNEAMFIHR